MAYFPQFPYINPLQDLAPAVPVSAVPAQEIRTLRVEGRGSATVQPTIARVQLGVATENRSLTTAQAENATTTTAVINALTRQGIPVQDIATQSYTITAQYDFVEGQQVFRGYRVVNTLVVTIRDINRVGQIIDAAVAAGANFVNDISFTVANPSVYYHQALALAIDDAVAKAMTIGRRLNVTVSPVPLRVIETTFTAAPVEPALLKTAEAAQTTPILPGQQEITARVEVTFSFS